MAAVVCTTQIKTALPGLAVEPRPIGDLTLKRRNARKHPPGQIERLSGAIEAFGFVAPIVIGSGDVVLAGEARLAAAKRVGLETVPTISLAHLKPQEQKAYMLADNQLATLATWDDVILSKELIELQDFELDFSLDVLGFSDIDLSRLTLLDDRQNPESAVAEDEPPALQSTAVTLACPRGVIRFRC
jgi:ParB-like chromosome segregation protein Spo0J